jgi:hypothetical protein
MLSMPRKWAEMPSSVRYAIIALAFGWATHFVFYFGYMADGQPERITYLQLGVGIGICYCVAAIKKWARRLCIYFNIGMVVLYAWAAVIFGWSALVFGQADQLAPLLLTAVTAAAFGLSLYFLLKKEVALFFSPPETDGEQDQGQGPSPPAP